MVTGADVSVFINLRRYYVPARESSAKGSCEAPDSARSCCMAQKIGLEEAERFGDAHENLPGNDPCERDMDFYNNDVSRRVGSSSPNGNCAELYKPEDLMLARNRLRC